GRGGGREDEEGGAGEGDEGAGLRRHHGGVIDRDEPAGAGLVDRDEARVARNVPAVVSGEEAHIGVVAVAGRTIGGDRDRLPGVEVGSGGGEGGESEKCKGDSLGEFAHCSSYAIGKPRCRNELGLLPLPAGERGGVRGLPPSR